MIFRRLAQSLKEQNWTTIFIEFVLLVLGVFLGLQAANWNDARNDRALESTYLASLAEDIRGDVEEIDEIGRVSTQRMAALGYLIRAASGKELPVAFESARGRIEIETVPAYDENDPKTIGISLFILTTLDGNRLTYDTLVDNAGINVIRDPALIRAIRSYYAAVDKALIFESEMKVSRVGPVDAQQQSGLSPADATPASELVQTFAGDPALLAAAKNYWLYTNRHLKVMKQLRRDALALVAQIDSGKQP